MQLKIFIILLLSCVPVMAQACMSTPEERRAHFDQLDGDEDGFLTLEEYYNNVDIPLADKQKHIAELDTDKDGKINFDEFNVMKQKQRC